MQPLRHVLSGADSILAKLMRLSSKVGTVIPEEDGKAAVQSGASSAAASPAHSGGQAAAAANVQSGGQQSGGPQPVQPAQRGAQPNQAPVGEGPQQAQRGAALQQAQRGAALQQAQRGADAHQARRDAPQQQAQRGVHPNGPQRNVRQQQAQQGPIPQQAQRAPQQAQHGPYYGPGQLPAFVPAAVVPAPSAQQMPIIAPAPLPPITAHVTHLQVWLTPSIHTCGIDWLRIQSHCSLDKMLSRSSESYQQTSRHILTAL